MNKTRRSSWKLSLFLVFVLLLMSVVCTVSYADDTAATADATPTEGYVLTIYNADGSIGYTINGTKSVSEFNLASALEDAYVFTNNAWIFGGTAPFSYEIVFYQDIVINEQVVIPEDKNVTIDLNGKAITSGYQADSTSKHIYPLNVYGTLTIKDTKGNGSITGRGLLVQSGSKLTVDGGSIYAIDSNGGSAMFMYGGDVVINGGHVEQKAEGTYNFAIQAPAGSVTVNGGWIGGNHGAIAVTGATVVVNDGELVCTGNAGMTDNVMYVDSGSLVINGGTFTADGDMPSGGACLYHASGSAVIMGGIFGGSSGGDVWGCSSTVIKGGKFENLIEKSHIAGGYELNADGYVVATESAPNATVEIKNPMILTPDDDYMCWPNGDDSINRPLQVIMNFKAQDTYEEACASKFGKWICDFYLTFKGVDGGVFSTEGCYLAGNYGSFGWIVIPADALATELECDIAYPIVSAYDANLTYENICDYVKDFTAAIYIAPALIEANPNFEVSLELRMTNPENSDDYMVVGAPAVYDAEALIGGIQKGEDIADLESNTQIGGEIVEENINVESAKDALVEAFPELAPEQVENAIIELEITVKDVVIAEDEAPSSYSYTVAPMFGIDDKQVKISELVEAITFRLPIHSKETKKAANVYHNGELMGVYEIKEENGEKFVEVSSASFSTFTVEPIEAPLPEYVAMIGETGYATLAEAIAAAQAGETIALIDNIILTETVTVPAGKDVTIDLCGYSISMEESIISTAYAIDNLGKLTLKDSNGNGSINARGIYNGYNNGNTVSTSVMIVNGVNINAKGTNGGACVFNYGTLTVNSGNFTSIGGYSLNNQATGVMTVNGGDANNGIYNCGNLVINDGNINGNRSGCHVIYNWNATLTINGGSFYNYNSGNSTIMVAGTSQATINAGTFGIKDGRVPGNGNTWTSCLLDTSNSGKLTVNGGTFNGGVRVQAGTTMEITGGSFNDVTGSNFNIYGSVVISGGSFTDDTAKTFAGKYLAPDFELNEDGVVVESVKPVAKIGDMAFATVADALAYAKNAGLTNVEITLVGETTADSADTFNLYTAQLFDSVTFKQADASKPYYIACIYTGSRTNGGVFTFDGVNIVVTDQYIFEGNVKLSGNSVIKSVAEANCFIYNGITTVEPGSKLYGVIDDLRAGDLIIDGGRTDGQYNAEPDMQDAILVISWAGDSVTVQNGAYVKVNAVNEIGRASVLAGTSLNVYGSKFEAWEYIENNGTINLDATALITTGKLYGAGSIVIDVTGFTGRKTVISSKDLIGFTGTVTLTGNADAKYEITENGLEIYYVAVAQIGDVTYETFADALAAAKDGDTIVLCADVVEPGRIYIAGKAITIDLAGYVISGTCNGSENSLVYIENGAELTVKDTVGTGKITYAAGTSNVGFTFDVKGKLVLESGIIELTGTWSIGYAVDVRPNSWGTEYTMGSAFVMNGGKILSSDGGVRVASSSAEAHKNVAASFEMNGGLIDAAWDGVFIQQSNTIYDDLSFTINGGTIESDLNPIRVYGPAPTGYVNDQNCMNIVLAGGTMTYTGTEAQTWIIEGILRVGGGSSADTIVANGDFVVSAEIAQSVTAPDGFRWVATDNGYALEEVILVPIEYTNVGLTDSFKISFAFPVASFADLNGYYVVITKTSANDASEETLVIPAEAWFKTAIEGVDHYVVDYAGVAAKEMMDVLSVVICDADGNTVSEPKTDSIQDYVMRKLSRSTEETLNTLLVDMLNYGAQAQIFFGYATDKLANMDLTDEQKAFASVARDYSDAMYSKTYAEGYNFTIANTLILENNIQLKAGFDLRSLDLSEDAKIVMTYVNVKGITVTTELSLKDYDYKNEVTLITCDGLTARDADVQITFELVDGENVIAAFTNSVEGFVARLSETSEKADVCTALMKYCDSAKAYFAN